MKGLSEVIDRARTRFRKSFARAPEGVVAAPGRLNLIGDHTDYQEGFVLPAAIDRYVVVVFGRRSDRQLRAHSLAFGDTRTCDLDRLSAASMPDWFGYVAGMAWALQAERLAPCGVDLVIGGTLPVGGGLSSSAALELATARALCASSDLPWDPVRMAGLGQRAERTFVGVRCGIMDQMVVATAREGCALLLDCRTLAGRQVALPVSWALVAMDSGIRRSLAQGAYNDRRRCCDTAVQTLRTAGPNIKTLRDVDERQLEAAKGLLEPLVYRRALHVVRESRRPGALAKAIEIGDADEAGRLMDASHASLRDLYDVSCPELDLLCELARRHSACVGARMTGAGFGGFAVALVLRDHALCFLDDVESAYQSRTNRATGAFACRPVDGVRLLSWSAAQ